MLEAGRRPRVLVLADLPGEAMARLRERCEVTVLAEGVASEAELAEHLDGIHGLLPLLTHRVGERALSAAPELAIVANYAVGVDNVDLAAAARHGVVVTNTPDVLTEDTADLTWALILSLLRRLRPAERLLRQGRFTGWQPRLCLGRSPRAATLGVLGAGRIGRAVLSRASAFGMRGLYHSRRSLGAAEERRLGARRRSLEELLAESDVVSLHLPLSRATRHLIDRRALARMRPGSYLVNTARGPLVDETALAEALASGHLAGAALDVFEEEPHVHPGLLEHPEVVLVPHIGSATRETRCRMTELAVQNLLRVLVENRPPLTPVAART